VTNYCELSLNDQSSAVICEYGGRLLGLFPSNEEISGYWINPQIQKAIKSNARDIGGSRYWISPEREYFYKDPSNWKDWHCQEGLDPAHYEIIGKNETSCTLSTSVSIFNYATKQRLNGEITRQFAVKKEPFKSGLKNYSCVEIIDDCVFYTPNLRLNGWSLDCILSNGISNPGTVLIPTKKDPKPLSYFRTIPSHRLTVGENYVAYKIDVDDIYKLAIRPDDIDFERKTKICYITQLPSSENYTITFKLSDDIPRFQDQCFDIARDHPNSEIGVVQSYNSESPDKVNLRYGEIELQLSQFATVDNTSHGKAVHQVISYVGTKDQMIKLVETFLGIYDFILF
jgi:hypothetical protein